MHAFYLELIVYMHLYKNQVTLLVREILCRLTYYRRLWLFSTCAYKLRLQETMRLTDNVRLTSGIIVATPSMRKHVIAKHVIDRS